jgi:hypothetical protein
MRRKERNLRDMRKRRVGVTAGSRVVVENRAIGTPQAVTEIAAPLVSRTPMGTAVTATDECGWKRGDTSGGKGNRADSGFGAMENPGENREMREGRRAAARMRRCLILRQGDKPPETPGPLSLGLDCTEGKKSVKGSLRRQPRPPLTDFFPSEETPPDMRERGPWSGPDHASRWSAADSNKSTGPPIDRGRPSHGSRDRAGAVRSRPFSAAC